MKANRAAPGRQRSRQSRADASHPLLTPPTRTTGPGQNRRRERGITQTPALCPVLTAPSLTCYPGRTVVHTLPAPQSAPQSTSGAPDRFVLPPRFWPVGFDARQCPRLWTENPAASMPISIAGLCAAGLRVSVGKCPGTTGQRRAAGWSKARQTPRLLRCCLRAPVDCVRPCRRSTTQTQSCRQRWASATLARQCTVCRERAHTRLW